jgi:hypothetical protein
MLAGTKEIRGGWDEVTLVMRIEGWLIEWSPD